MLPDGAQIVATAAKMAIDPKLCQISFSAESIALPEASRLNLE
ncbi:hypothetical protein [Chamaesiphon sp. GL140_3_metabinner_50]|nr:hypothetical protein [Chamaesiphon sp. GL140_3_metabinner_50]